MKKIIIYIDGGARGNPGPSLRSLSLRSSARLRLASLWLLGHPRFPIPSYTGEHPVPPTPLCGPGLLRVSEINFSLDMKKIIIYIDGGARGNPGPAAIGVVFCNERGQVIKRYSQYLGRATNNEAEYKALIFALKKFKALFGKKLAKSSEIEIRSDSELLTKQMRGEYKILNKKIQLLFLEAWNQKLDFKKVRFRLLISREKNKEADKLVNEALDKK